MNPVRSLCLCLTLPLLAAAQEATTIEQVKKDLSTLPATKADLEQSRLKMPSIAAPDTSADTLTALPPPAALGGRANEEKEADKNSGNWLVDAMRKETDRNSAGRDDRKRLRDDDREPADAWPEPGKNRARDSFLNTSTQKASEERDPTTLKASVDNPLMPYMTDWISKRDQSLLLPKPASLPGFDGNQSFLPSGPAGATTPGLIQGDFGIRPDNAVAPVQRPENNPFLENLTSVPVPARDSTPSAMPNSLPNATERSLQFLPPPVNPNEAKRPPAPIDLSKPAQDTKYFPQLKRF
jgi:hypothetical protein